MTPLFAARTTPLMRILLGGGIPFSYSLQTERS
jgi:hypothetical protein